MPNPPVPLNERLLSVKELARLIGVSTRWIHERTRRHEIPCYRFGTAVRFSPEEIRAWLAQYRDTARQK